MDIVAFSKYLSKTPQVLANLPIRVGTSFLTNFHQFLERNKFYKTAQVFAEECRALGYPVDVYASNAAPILEESELPESNETQLESDSAVTEAKSSEVAALEQPRRSSLVTPHKSDLPSQFCKIREQLYESIVQQPSPLQGNAIFGENLVDICECASDCQNICGRPEEWLSETTPGEISNRTSGGRISVENVPRPTDKKQAASETALPAAEDPVSELPCEHPATPDVVCDVPAVSQSHSDSVAAACECGVTPDSACKDTHVCERHQKSIAAACECGVTVDNACKDPTVCEKHQQSVVEAAACECGVTPDNACKDLTVCARHQKSVAEACKCGLQPDDACKDISVCARYLANRAAASLDKVDRTEQPYCERLQERKPTPMPSARVRNNRGSSFGHEPWRSSLTTPFHQIYNRSSSSTANHIDPITILNPTAVANIAYAVDQIIFAAAVSVEQNFPDAVSKTNKKHRSISTYDVQTTSSPNSPCSPDLYSGLDSDLGYLSTESRASKRQSQIIDNIKEYEKAAALERDQAEAKKILKADPLCRNDDNSHHRRNILGEYSMALGAKSVPPDSSEEEETEDASIITLASGSLDNEDAVPDKKEGTQQNVSPPTNVSEKTITSDANPFLISCVCDNQRPSANIDPSINPHTFVPEIEEKSETTSPDEELVSIPKARIEILERNYKSLKSKFSKLQNDHSRLMALTAELTVALETSVLGEEADLKQVLKQCVEIYPELFTSGATGAVDCECSRNRLHYVHTRRYAGTSGSDVETAPSSFTILRPVSQFSEPESTIIKTGGEHHTGHRQSDYATRMLDDSSVATSKLSYTTHRSADMQPSSLKHDKPATIMTTKLSSNSNLLDRNRGPTSATGYHHTAVAKKESSVTFDCKPLPNINKKPDTSSVYGKLIDSSICPNSIASDDFTSGGNSSSYTMSYNDPPDEHRRCNKKHSGIHREHEVVSSDTYFHLDFIKIENDLKTGATFLKMRLLQALRWRLTHSSVEIRDTIILSYVQNDLLSFADSCSNLSKSHSCVLLASLYFPQGLETPHPLQQCIARLVNALASLKIGRDYLTMDSSLLHNILLRIVLKGHRLGFKFDTESDDMVIATLQKLSLRNNQRLVMINEGLVEYLVIFFSKKLCTLTMYCLEYGTALWMNLCLHKEARVRCEPIAQEALNLVIELYDIKFTQCLPYVNGTLYSLLTNNILNTKAKQCGLPAVLQIRSRQVEGDMKRQLEFIVRVLNEPQLLKSLCVCEPTNEPVDEVDLLEAELDSDDPLQEPWCRNKICGEKLLYEVYAIEGLNPDITKSDRASSPPFCIITDQTVVKRPRLQERTSQTPSFMLLGNEINDRFVHTSSSLDKLITNTELTDKVKKTSVTPTFVDQQPNRNKQKKTPTSQATRETSDLWPETAPLQRSNTDESFSEVTKQYYRKPSRHGIFDRHTPTVEQTVKKTVDIKQAVVKRYVKVDGDYESSPSLSASSLNLENNTDSNIAKSDHVNTLVNQVSEVTEKCTREHSNRDHSTAIERSVVKHLHTDSAQFAGDKPPYTTTGTNSGHKLPETEPAPSSHANDPSAVSPDVLVLHNSQDHITKNTSTRDFIWRDFDNAKTTKTMQSELKVELVDVAPNSTLVTKSFHETEMSTSRDLQVYTENMEVETVEMTPVEARQELEETTILSHMSTTKLQSPSKKSLTISQGPLRRSSSLIDRSLNRPSGLISGGRRPSPDLLYKPTSRVVIIPTAVSRNNMQIPQMIEEISSSISPEESSNNLLRKSQSALRSHSSLHLTTELPDDLSNITDLPDTEDLPFTIKEDFKSIKKTRTTKGCDEERKNRDGFHTRGRSVQPKIVNTPITKLRRHKSTTPATRLVKSPPPRRDDGRRTWHQPPSFTRTIPAPRQTIPTMEAPSMPAMRYPAMYQSCRHRPSSVRDPPYALDYYDDAIPPPTQIPVATLPPVYMPRHSHHCGCRHSTSLLPPITRMCTGGNHVVTSTYSSIAHPPLTMPSPTCQETWSQYTTPAKVTKSRSCSDIDLHHYGHIHYHTMGNRQTAEHLDGGVDSKRSLDLANSWSHRSAIQVRVNQPPLMNNGLQNTCSSQHLDRSFNSQSSQLVTKSSVLLECVTSTYQVPDEYSHYDVDVIDSMNFDEVFESKPLIPRTPPP